MKAMFSATVGLSFSPFGSVGHGSADVMAGATHSQPPPRLSGIVKLDEEVRGVRQVSVAAGDEALDVGEDVIGQSRRRLRRITTAAAGCAAIAAASAHARASARSLTIFSTVSSGYALKNTSDGT